VKFYVKFKKIKKFIKSHAKCVVFTKSHTIFDDLNYMGSSTKQLPSTDSPPPSYLEAVTSNLKDNKSGSKTSKTVTTLHQTEEKTEIQPINFETSEFEDESLNELVNETKDDPFHNLFNLDAELVNSFNQRMQKSKNQKCD
jgi:hypothetical protein